MTLLDYIRSSHLAFEAPCDGRGQCGRCRVILADVPYTKTELRLLSMQDRRQQIHLACCQAYHEGMRFEIPKAHMEILDELKRLPGNGRDGYGLICDLGTMTIVMKWIRMRDGEGAPALPYVTYLGGCCGTDATYITELKDLLEKV